MEEGILSILGYPYDKEEEVETGYDGNSLIKPFMTAESLDKKPTKLVNYLHHKFDSASGMSGGPIFLNSNSEKYPIKGINTSLFTYLSPVADCDNHGLRIETPPYWSGKLVEEMFKIAY